MTVPQSENGLEAHGTEVGLMSKSTADRPTQTVGLDVGDRSTQICVLNADGEILEEASVRTTEEAYRSRFAGGKRLRMVLEVGPHSPWTTRLLDTLGHEVIAANPRKLRLIYENDQKSDRADAEYLARVGRLDPELLAPVNHRSVQAQADRAVLRARDQLVKIRTQLVNHVRGTVKTVGRQLPSCSTETFPETVWNEIPPELVPALDPILDHIDRVNEQIRDYDREIEWLCTEAYPETDLLRQIDGVSPITALCYVLTIEDPTRFEKSRTVGAYLGLVPKRKQSGDTDQREGITKAGDETLRRLLVEAANYILGPFGKDCDLRRWGLRLADEGGEHGRKRAAVAVARKLAVLLHRLWITGEAYESLRNADEEAG